MSLFSRTRLALSLSILGLLGGCGGASSSAPAAAKAASLAYTDPTGTGWRLMKDSTSTPTRLVLNLVGPAGEKGRGVGLNLRAGTMVTFAKFPGGGYINDLGVFKLTNKAGAMNIYGELATRDVTALVGGLKEGGRVLSVGAFQKDRRWPAQALDRPLFQIAIDLDATQAMGQAAGVEIPLTFLRARSIPEYIGDNPEDPNADRSTWAYDYRIDEVQVAVGKLTTGD